MSERDEKELHDLEKLRECKKVETLFRDLQENDEVIFKDNQEYQQAIKEFTAAMYALKKDMPIEKIRELNNCDDKAIGIQALILKEYYIQGYMAGNK